jgi:hypothetical protein
MPLDAAVSNGFKESVRESSRFRIMATDAPICGIEGSSFTNVVAFSSGVKEKELFLTVLDDEGNGDEFLVKLNFRLLLFPLAGATITLERSSGGGTRKRGEFWVIGLCSTSAAAEAA